MLGAHIALAVGAVAVGARACTRTTPGIAASRPAVDAVRLDIDDMAAAQHLAGQFGHRALQRDACRG